MLLTDRGKISLEPVAFCGSFSPYSFNYQPPQVTRIKLSTLKTLAAEGFLWGQSERWNQSIDETLPSTRVLNHFHKLSRGFVRRITAHGPACTKAGPARQNTADKVLSIHSRTPRLTLSSCSIHKFTGAADSFDPEHVEGPSFRI